MASNPLNLISERFHMPLMLTFLAIAAFSFLALRNYDRKLLTPVSPNRIISLELATTSQEADKIIRLWEMRGNTRDALLSVLWDFVFIAGYAPALALVCFWISESSRIPNVVIWAGFAVLLAGAFDVVENVAMARMIRLGAEDPFPQITSVCAGIKFTLIAGVLLVLASSPFLRKRTA